MLLDILILVVVLASVYAGFQRGLLQPLLAELLFLLTILILLRERGPFAALLHQLVNANGVVDVLAALLLALAGGYLGAALGRMLMRMPVIRGADGFFGVFVHFLVAVTVLYLGISGLVAMDRAFAPLFQAATLTAVQADQLQRSLASNPLSAIALDSKEKAQLQRDARSKDGARIGSLSQLNQVQDLYRGLLRPQLHGSRLAPVVLRLGSRLPLVSRLGPSSIPK